MFLRDGDAAGLRECLASFEATVRAEYRETDPGFTVGLEKIDEAPAAVVYTEASQKKLLNLLVALPYGVMAMEPALENLVRTSTNIGVVGLESGRIHIDTKQRGSLVSEMKSVSDMIRSCAGTGRGKSRGRRGISVLAAQSGLPGRQEGPQGLPGPVRFGARGNRHPRRP